LRERDEAPEWVRFEDFTDVGPDDVIRGQTRGDAPVLNIQSVMLLPVETRLHDIELIDGLLDLLDGLEHHNDDALVLSLVALFGRFPLCARFL